MLTADSPEVQRFLAAWHENGRAEFERNYSNLVYDDYAPKTAHDRSKRIALDRGNEHNRSGVFLVDKVSHHVYSIKGYGRPNRLIGHLEALTLAYETSTAVARPLPTPGYASNDHMLGDLAATAGQP
jgi:hypothetical protein